MATNLPSKEETLAPCPFCKVATNLRIANIIGGARAVNCTLCGTVGPHSELSDDYADEDAREQWNRGRAVETTADDRTQLHGALVRVVLEAEGCPPTCSHEFHKMAMASVIKIAKDALKRTSSVKAPAEPVTRDTRPCAVDGCPNDATWGYRRCVPHMRELDAEKTTTSQTDGEPV
jgi:hypothetical protein